MKTARAFSPGFFSHACILLLIGAGHARAEMDFEFARALMGRSTAEFSTDDLIEHLISQLHTKPETARDAKLIKATHARQQAFRASPERRAALLDDANALFREFKDGPRNHRLYAIAERESASAARELLLAKLQMAKDRPDLAGKLWSEAATLAEKAVSERKAEAAPLYNEFKKWYDAYREFVKRNPNKAVPGDLELALQKSFDAWAIADKRLVVALTEQLECYKETDPQRKKLADALIKYCEDKSIDEVIANFATLSAWYSFMQGKACALTGDHAAAKEAWELVTDAETGALLPEQRREILALKKHILRETVTMFMAAKKSTDVIDIVERALRKPDYATIFSEDLGKAIILDYATAQISQPDAESAAYETAAARLQEFADKETRGAEHNLWRSQFSQALADLVKQARSQNISLKLSAMQWYHAAYGTFIKGQQHHLKHTEQLTADAAKARESHDQALQEFSGAIEAYRRALTLARAEKGDLQLRLTIEPKAWFESGLCHLKMRQYYEAIIAYSSMRQTFLPALREKWLSERLKTEPKTSRRKIDELLRSIDPLLENSGKNLIYALEQNRALRIKPENTFDQDILKKLADDPQLAGRMQDPRFYAAQTDLTAASNLFRSLKTAAQTERDKLLSEAAAKFTSAAEKFLQVDPSASSYEMSLYQAAAAYARAHDVRVIAKPSGRDSETRHAARKALEAFEKFQAFVAAHPSTDPQKLQQRNSMQGATHLAQSSLFGVADDWTAAVKSADAYLTHPAAESKDAALFNKFRALLELAAASEAPTGDAFLANAESSAAEYRKLKPDNTAQIDFMYKALSRRYLVAAAQGRQKALPQSDVETYFSRAAAAQEARLALLESPDLSEYANLLSILDKSSDKRKAADFAQKLLEKFDPSDLNAAIPDEPEIWQGMLRKMNAVINYAVLDKWDRCKADHKILIDYMYDTREGAALPENNIRRPDYDRYNQSLEKALAQIASIKKNFPDCQTLDSKFGENGRSFIAIITGEIDYRRKIQATRTLLSSLALTVSEKLSRQKDEECARRYRELANKQIKIALANSDDPATRLESGTLDMMNGKHDEALKTFREVRDGADENSVLYFDASRKMSELYSKKQEWQLAADFPEFLVLTGADDTPRAQERWPDLHDFLKRCYDNGAKKPAGLKLKP